MKTRTVGDILREERQYHRLSIEELAKRTRIRPEYLTALEHNQFDQLPASVFVKGYIRSYSQIFGFDPQPLLGLLRRDYKESAKGTLVPREFIKPVLRKRWVWTPVTLVMFLVVSVATSLLLYFGVQWRNLNSPPALEVFVPTDNATVAAQVEVKGIADVDATVSVNSQPVALQPDGSFETKIFLPQEGLSSVTVEAINRRGKSTQIQRTVLVRF